MTTYQPISKNGVEQAEPLEFPTKRLTITTTVQYRGRTFQVSAEGWTMDRLCDMLDEKFGAAWTAPNGKEHTAAQETAPTCPTHNKPMKQGKNGHYFCPTKLPDDTWCREKAK